MLHILWMLIKIILLILGIVLGLAVLLLLLLLFCPVRYNGSALKLPGDLKNTEVHFKISWLFGGVSLRLLLKNGVNQKEFRLFGIPVSRLFHKRKKRKRISGKIPRDHRQKSFYPDSQTNKTGTAELSSSENKTILENRKRNSESGSSRRKTVFFQQLKNKISLFLEKLKRVINLLYEIPEKIKSISLSIEGIYVKIDNWKQLLEHPKVQAAVQLIKREIKIFYTHCFPKKISGKVRFGSENPSVTGAVLAILGITFPVHKNRVEILPVYENKNLLEGTIKLKGRIYGFVPLKIFIELYFDKNIKYTIYRWKNKEV